MQMSSHEGWFWSWGIIPRVTLGNSVLKRVTRSAYAYISERFSSRFSLSLPSKSSWNCEIPIYNDAAGIHGIFNGTPNRIFFWFDSNVISCFNSIYFWMSDKSAELILERFLDSLDILKIGLVFGLVRMLGSNISVGSNFSSSSFLINRP